jgi:DNA-binding MarR family transcriptional regulator
LEKNAGRLIWAAHRKSLQYVAERLRDCDIDVGQFFFLRYILKHQGISQEEIASNLYLDKTTVSKGVNQLVGRGYIQKKTNPKDKREKQLFVTQKAAGMEEKIDTIYEEINAAMFNALSEKEMNQLTKILQKIV